LKLKLRTAATGAIVAAAIQQYNKMCSHSANSAKAAALSQNSAVALSVE